MCRGRRKSEKMEEMKIFDAGGGAVRQRRPAAGAGACAGGGGGRAGGAGWARRLTCGTDLKVYRRGYHAKMLTPPMPFGHELAGMVVTVGEGVTDLRWATGWCR